MSRPVTRYAYYALFLIGAITIVYILGSGAGGPRFGNPLERFAEGDLSGLDFSRAGQDAPLGTFTGPSGEEMTLADLQGRTILVNFWATWCGPCEREMPHLGALQTGRGGEDFAVIAISVDDAPSKEAARIRLDELAGQGVLDFYHAPPEAWEIVYGAGAAGFPTSIIYDETGQEVARLAGEADWSAGVALGFVDAVLAR
ncbi:MAG: TlpA disulfide reductase family protein [Pseudomonadota bacterium]